MNKYYLFLLLFLTSCAPFISVDSSKTVDLFYVANRLEAQFPELDNKIHLDDQYYHLVNKKQVQTIADSAWRPWLEDKGDCDDQASRMLFHIREKYYDNRFASSAPAIGQLTGYINNDEPHAILWFLTIDGLFFYDPTEQKFVDPSTITAWRAFCK